MISIWNVARDQTRMLLRPLPPQVRRSVEQWLHNRYKFSKLNRANAIVVSYPKSGRTWMRALLSYYLKDIYRLPQCGLITFDNYSKLNPSIPRTAFTHDRFFETSKTPAEYYPAYERAPVVLIARDPRDTLVSAWHHVRFRMNADKRVIFSRDKESFRDLEAYARDPVGLARICSFYSRWARVRTVLPNVCTVRYEDFCVNTVMGL